MTESETGTMHNHNISELDLQDLIQHPHFTDEETEAQTESFGQLI